jgi:hypothetical protein
MPGTMIHIAGGLQGARERKGNIMWNAFALLVGVRGALEGWNAKSRIPEPKFEPFDFSRESPREARPIRSLGGAGVSKEPRTLQELGVPGSLAAEMESTLRLMGMVDGDEVRGFTFRTPEGATYSLRTATGSRARTDRAA